MDDKEELVVTIRCLTYNHEPYIRQCLEGFVMQKTNFRFEAIVHDDASTDKTAEIVKEYAEKYPEIIKPIFETENQYSKKDGSLGRIMDEHTRGKYVALCEGDDYWIDPYKLQKQVDFLENNKEYSMCFSSAKVIYDSGVSKYYKSDELYQGLEEREYTGNEILEDWIVPTASVIYKNEMCVLIPRDKRFVFGDIIVFLTCAKYGKVYCIADKTSVYRRNINGATFQRRDSLKFVNHYKAIEEHFGKRYHKIIYNLISSNYVGAIIENRKSGNLFNIIKDIFLDIRYMPGIILRLNSKLFNLINRGK